MTAQTGRRKLTEAQLRRRLENKRAMVFSCNENIKEFSRLKRRYEKEARELEAQLTEAGRTALAENKK